MDRTPTKRGNSTNPNNPIFSNEDTDFKNLVNNSGGIAQAIDDKKNIEATFPPSLLSPVYQRQKYTNANAAAISIGAFAVDNTFHALAQKLNHEPESL